jgi:hypothetical protein
MYHRILLAGLLLAWSFVGCGDDSDSSEADRRGVGAECRGDEECTEEGQVCLPFKGGYCGISGCEADEECPEGSACVRHEDGTNYCFLICRDKAECNSRRSSEVESNCSSNVTFVDERRTDKACVPPSSD